MDTVALTVVGTEGRQWGEAFPDSRNRSCGKVSVLARLLPFLWLAVPLVSGAETLQGQESLSVHHLDVTLVVGRDGSLEVEERVQLLPAGGRDSRSEPPRLHRPLPLQQRSLYGGGVRRIRWGNVNVSGPDEEPRRWQLTGHNGGQALLATQALPGEVTLRYVGHGLVEQQGQTAGLRWTLVPWTWERNIQTVNVWFVLPLGVTGVQASIQGAGQHRGVRGVDQLESRFLFQLDLADVPVTGDPPILQARWDSDILRSPSLISLVGRGLSAYWPLLLPLVSLGFLVRQRVQRRPVPNAGVLPDGLTSAEAGFLVNLRVEARDLVATLLEMERRGALEFLDEGGATPLLGLQRPRRVLLAPRPGSLPDNHPGLSALRELVGPESNTISPGESPEALHRAMSALREEVEIHLVNRGFLERPLSQMAGHGMSLAVGFLLVGVALAGLGVQYLLLRPDVAYGAAVLTALPFALRHHLVPPWTAAGRRAQAAVEKLQRELARGPVGGMEAWRLALVGPPPQSSDPGSLKGAGAASAASTGAHLLEEVEVALSPGRGWRGGP